ncbi:MAG: YceI family protein [Wenzhouxiangella sp.]
MKTLLSSLILLVMLTACQAVPRPSGIDEVRPAGDRATTLPQGRIYRIDQQASEIRIVVYPGGTLARFGHAHVIGGAVVSGTVVAAEPFEDSGLSLVIDVPAMEVDRPAWRRDEGFDPELSDSAIEGTRENLFSDQVLDAEQFPVIRIDSLSLSGPAWQPDIELSIELRGERRELTVPVALEFSDAGLTATGQLRFRQSDFGMTPFSALGGRLAVADEVLVRFRLVARVD